MTTDPIKIRPLSPTTTQRTTTPLNTAVVWKVWVKLEDDLNSSINQSIAIEFTQHDTVDDLKSKLLLKLNKSRWSTLNDNTSIAIGLYIETPKIMGHNVSKSPRGSIYMENNLFKSKPKLSLQQSIGNNTSINNTDTHELFTFNKSFSSTALNRDFNTIKTSNLHTVTSSGALISQQLQERNSPFIYPQGHSPKISAFSKFTGLSLSPINTLQISNFKYNSNGIHRQSISASRNDLKYLTEIIDNNTSRIIFEPDEIIIRIYSEVFGPMGVQQSSEPLQVFTTDISNSINIKSRRCSQIDVPLSKLSSHVNNENMNINHSNNISPNSNNNTKNLAETNKLKRDIIMNYELRSSSNNNQKTSNDTERFDDTNIDSEMNSPTFNPNTSSDNLRRESVTETEPDFRIITDEEQLRKVSNSIANDENILHAPKQAILLLPKNFEGDVKFESQQNDAYSPTSADMDLKSKKPNIIPFQEGDTVPHSGLQEQEIGLIHPLLEGSPSNEPTLPNTPPNINSRPTLTDSNIIHKGLQTSQTNSNIVGTTDELKSTTNPVKPKMRSTSENIFPRINILIVEDNVINQTILGSFLRKNKIFYKVAKNGREAVDKWKEGGIHLIFMDLQLPVLSGTDAAKEIRQYEKKIGIGIQKKQSSSSDLSLSESFLNTKSSACAPVIIVAFTASNSLADKRAALIAGCNDYLTKPVNLHWLSKKITEWGCMQGLIDFDNWKQGQSRMTNNVLVKKQASLKSRKSGTKIPTKQSSSHNIEADNI
ncbi:hypothetical protein TBLA_0D03170 [Henningerozyma blattae CBS 6284]|uniref:Response regulatory domain-containing protein n=1 Tax=Henningerozyma blattae (strain ATCC 34711 / CBS 6284 / DSM 70876 / NBRC 10599 / NRRL Y-10934 / UCD 77-7) TaxID=1071380 RepID=I2H365_HENB6|nr:hypothetical protein TBLA_0D03170 [Tetrapisispora blattae CBS 6284]CCH60817.1 hypothetical protein TBLA_0D03170 [Tetrapisispora blattae CBS 6284]